MDLFLPALSIASIPVALLVLPIALPLLAAVGAMALR